MTASEWNDGQRAWLTEFVGSVLRGEQPGVRVRHKRKGDVVIEKGAQISHILLIMKGSVSAYAISPKGRVALIEDDVGARRWLFASAHELAHYMVNPHTVRATEETEVVAFEIGPFRRLLDEHPILHTLFTMGLSDDLNSVNVKLENVIFNSAPMRFARWLHERFDGRPIDTVSIEKKLMASTPIGQLIGVSRETARKIRKDFLKLRILTDYDRERFRINRGPLKDFLTAGEQDE